MYTKKVLSSDNFSIIYLLFNTMPTPNWFLNELLQIALK
nr:MAG TPA: hypothetical protein [Caudoviricetes sp.]